MADAPESNNSSVAQEEKVSFKDTLNLPRTEFPIRPNAKEDDPAMLRRWADEDLYQTSFVQHEGNPRFIFHDGPPYANGHIHLGSAYNKILKDIACKSRRMFGMQVPVTPGWDCHGLPIELKVTQEQPDLSRPELIQACRDYAHHWVGVQKEEFKRLGVLMNWDYPYLTMNFSYEAKELRAFGTFVKKGYIERSNKTVPWCASCQTVLAAAEIEYYDRTDPSIYVLFPLTRDGTKKLFPKISDPIYVTVWTTTPWTLPLNRAVLIKPNTPYLLLLLNDQYLLIGKERADDLIALVGGTKRVMAEVTAEQLAGLLVMHPLIEDRIVPLLLDPMVLTNEGTAFVHCAPGAGPQDYETGVKNNLEIYSPVGSDGKYTDAIEPKELVGMPVLNGQSWVLKTLAARDRLLHKTSIKHSYPHCWRCRKGLIFRATKQWFFNLAQEGLKERVLKATETIATLPEKSINRLQATIEGRLEWCISRQRAWGVPIPALVCTTCDYTHITKEFINKVADGVAKEGIEFWHHVALADLAVADLKCPSCGAQSFKKEQDTLDVWFDSGISHFAVLSHNSELGYPADLYLEGKDQHRGWFQSSLLTSMALEGTPTMKMIITHGFTVDAKGHKMSKSLGNVVAPQEMIDTLGTDGLRLWASSIDFSSEAVVSDVLIRNVQEVFRKVRNTCRFLLSNLYDFDIEKDAVPFADMRTIDQYALQDLFEFNYAVLDAYARYDFTSIFHQLSDYCSVNLSMFYLEIVKDCLYVERADGHARRSVQTACYHILDTLTRLMAPIFSFTAEQISDLYQKGKTESIHLQRFNLLHHIADELAQQNKELKNKLPALEEIRAGIFDKLHTIAAVAFTKQQEKQWQMLKTIRSAILKETETLREQNIIKRSLDARVTMFVDSKSSDAKQLRQFFDALNARGESPEQFFKDFAILSQFVLHRKTTSDMKEIYPGVHVKAQKAVGDKCPRCWQWAQTNHKHHLCDRCYNMVK